MSTIIEENAYLKTLQRGTDKSCLSAIMKNINAFYIQKVNTIYFLYNFIPTICSANIFYNDIKNVNDIYISKTVL